METVLKFVGAALFVVAIVTGLKWVGYLDSIPVSNGSNEKVRRGQLAEPTQQERIVAKDSRARSYNSHPPEITAYDTFEEGDLIFLRLHYIDPDGDAEGFGFRGVKGSGWAEESHPFSDPSYGRVSEGTIAYPFNHLAASDYPIESDVEAWIYDKKGLRSDPVTVHLRAQSQARLGRSNDKPSMLPEALLPKFKVGPWEINKRPVPERQQDVSAAFIGRWVGTVIQTGPVEREEYPVAITLEKPQKVGVRIGTAEYKTLKCGGSLVFVKLSGNILTLEERLDRRVSTCLDRSKILMAANEDGTLSYSALNPRAKGVIGTSVLKKRRP